MQDEKTNQIFILHLVLRGLVMRELKIKHTGSMIAGFDVVWTG
jgi:hypothetical protein